MNTMFLILLAGLAAGVITGICESNATSPTARPGLWLVKGAGIGTIWFLAYQMLPYFLFTLDWSGAHGSPWLFGHTVGALAAWGISHVTTHWILGLPRPRAVVTQAH